MNAFEIVKTIIPDGINQSQEPIWERLLLPDFDTEKPKIIYSHFKTPEEFLDYELKKLTDEDEYFEKEYIASKPMMSEEEYSTANFSHHYKAYVPDYFEYQEKWKIDHETILKIENCRKELILLLTNGKLTVKEFNSLKRSYLIFSSLDIYNLASYLDYVEVWNKAQTEEGKNNVIEKFETRWFLDFHYCYYWLDH